VIRPQIWNGVKNNGEFGLSGSYIEFEGDLAPMPYIAHIDFVNTDLGLDVAAQDLLSDVGYLVSFCAFSNHSLFFAPKILYLAPTRNDQMAKTLENISQLDPIWGRLVQEAQDAVEQEPLLGGMLHSCVLHHRGIEQALAYRIASKLASPDMSEQLIREICDQAYESEPSLAMAARADIAAVYERDPACHRYLQPLMFFKGFQAVQAYRVAHWLWNDGRKDLAYLFQMRVSESFGIDIHPAARIGKGIMIDHAHSIVIGETAVVGDNVSMLHSVTLGGTGKEEEDRHPKIGDNVLIGAGAKVLGNIKVGNCSRIAAGSVVLHEVPPKTTVAGVPAKVVGEAGCPNPSVSMNQILPVSE